MKALNTLCINKLQNTATPIAVLNSSVKRDTGMSVCACATLHS